MSVVHDSTAATTASRSLAQKPHQFEQLEKAVTIALAALEYPDPITWSDALARTLCVLGGADGGAVLIPGDGVQWRAVSARADAIVAERPGAIHEEVTERFHPSIGTDLVLWARDDLAVDAGSSAIASSGTVGIRVRSGSHVAAICIHRDLASGPAPQQLLAALRAIAPAFRAGVSAWVDATTSRSAIARMLDSLGDPALIFDTTGALVHANPSAVRMDASRSGSRIQSEAQCIAWTIGASARRRASSRQTGTRAEPATESVVVRRVRDGATVYELRGSIVGGQLLGAGPAVLVTITTAMSEPLSDEALRSDFGLTAREIQVARLIAEGLSNSEIADRLGVRFFTARNHVERTLAKLGVPSRNRVGPLLRNEAARDQAA
jgi:DNA-binding CsgD family transcriptional regulator